jgi:protein TonB
MASLDNGHPNWLLRGLIVVSVGVHILILAKISGIGKSDQTSYIELEIQAEEKPTVRSIPVPTRREEMLTRVETPSAPAPAPQIFAAADAMLQKPRTEMPELLSWTRELPLEKVSPAPTQEIVAEDVSGELSDNYYRQVLEKIEENRKYPYAARKMKVEGRVVVRFVIESDGAARSVEIVAGSGSRLLDKAALAAVTASSPFPVPPPEVFSEAVPLEVDVIFRINNN